MMILSGKNWLYKVRLISAFAPAALGLAVAPGSPAHAQNTVQQTPPELRDFKLDPEKPKPAAPPLPQSEPDSGTNNKDSNKSNNKPLPVPLPMPAPLPQARPQKPIVATPRPAAPRSAIQLPDIKPVAQTRVAPSQTAPTQTVPSQSVPSQSVPTQTVPSPAAVSNGSNSPSVQSPVKPATKSPVVESANGSSLPGGVPEIEQEPAADKIQVDTIGSPQSYPFGSALLAAAVLAAFAGAFMLWRRKRSTNQDAPDQDVRVQETTEPITGITGIASADIAVASLPVPIAPVSARIAKRPNIEINFIPVKATLSLAKLTIKGQIRIINNGQVAAKSMQLRAAIISANTNQEQQITEFHNNSMAAGDTIGAAGVGERIAMDIDLIIPLSELISFAMNGKQLFAPIVVAHIDYEWDNGTPAHRDIAKISCLIGREATPPKSKMGPLRLDLGPRSFAPLGQRPLFA